MIGELASSYVDELVSVLDSFVPLVANLGLQVYAVYILKTT